jgi:hypothetical protein
MEITMMGPDSGWDVSSLWSRSGAATVDFSERNEIGHRELLRRHRRDGGGRRDDGRASYLVAFLVEADCLQPGVA